MKKKILKYFSILLILLLINSNFSFAHTYMVCMMSKVQTVCECEHDSRSTGVQEISTEPLCCKVKLTELNNSNTLKLDKLSVIKVITFQPIHYFVSSILNSGFSFNYILHKTHFKPPSDIPILLSHILI